MLRVAGHGNQAPSRLHATGYEGDCGESFEAELSTNQVAKGVLDFRMSRYRSFLSISRISVDIVATTVSFQVAAGFDKFSQEFVPFQMATSICLV
jgi:hypothetical protein